MTRSQFARAVTDARTVAVGAVAALVVLGFKFATPDERLGRVELHAADLDSAIARHVRAESANRDSVNQKLNVLLILQCPGARELTARALCDQVRPR